MNRKEFLHLTSLAGLGFFGLQLINCSNPKNKFSAKGFGDLKPDPNGLFNLPDGFSYHVICESGQIMTDGYFVPGLPDGMGAFSGGDGRVILICNHEIHPNKVHHSPYGKKNQHVIMADPKKTYDLCNGIDPCIGGTTTIIYNSKTKKVEQQFLSLTGTVNNCSGGVTPWGSWITCEEFDDGDIDVLKKGNFFQKEHGYNFEVPAIATELLKAEPLKAMGRFNHEGVAIDSKTGICYQTEDQDDGLFYRFIPNENGKLSNGGKLQALALANESDRDIRNWNSKTAITVGEKLAVRWIDLDDVEAKNESLASQGKRKGALEFARGEGIWFINGQIYFCCTEGGNKRLGQILCYTPSPFEGNINEMESAGIIEIFVESQNSILMNSCDNITLAPNGDLIICEDAGHGSRVLGVTAKGNIYPILENVGYDSELTGGVFSPDGTTFFVNVQAAGKTLAITGPWQRLQN